uniref:F-box associated domain-containing protein n=1 Tax=Hordeum vulgare subsp. vulgare TaxID=112509 RepID=A0A8I6WMT8_HORVV
MGSGIPPRHFTVKLPHGHSDLVSGCFGKSSGFLQCALPEESGRTVAVFNLDSYHSDKWSLKYRLSMGIAFGRDDFLHGDDEGWFHWLDYQIVALDSEKKVLFLVDKVRMKLLSYDIITGKLSEVEDGCRTDYLYYVACYSKLPILSSLEHRQETL